MNGVAEWMELAEQTLRQWRTGKPGVLQSMGLQRAGHDLESEQEQQQQKKNKAFCLSAVSHS